MLTRYSNIHKYGIHSRGVTTRVQQNYTCSSRTFLRIVINFFVFWALLSSHVFLVGLTLHWNNHMCCEGEACLILILYISWKLGTSPVIKAWFHIFKTKLGLLKSSLCIFNIHFFIKSGICSLVLARYLGLGRAVVDKTHMATKLRLSPFHRHHAYQCQTLFRQTVTNKEMWIVF